MKSPIFIFSLPRSGSTLLQRILMSHNKIASLAEPWFLLPIINGLRNDSLLTNYNHSLAIEAVRDFQKNLPNQVNDINQGIKQMSDYLYEKQCKQNEYYFLDKTPRYYEIIQEISEIYPNAKFIFLFRNPIQVFSSIISTWGKNRFYNIHLFYNDLMYGPSFLSKGVETLRHNNISVNYSDLVNSPENEIKRICSYLEIDYSHSMLSNFQNQDTKGRMGDPAGVNEFSGIIASSENKWKEIFNTFFRKKVLRYYIKKLSDDDLLIQGFEKDQLLKDVKELKISRVTIVKDIIDLIYSMLILKLNLNLFFGKKTNKKIRGKYYS